ncbi:hypothetical protein [Mycolicibacterium stellerae]|uniref:hypothetical protein n=1 Tax=Mycolicibacterium stellerae TaxID=2358193 RepID=UPI000F0B00C6|nr:hypothetical protein [Mycolicibacterium stellerae]
MTASTRKTSAQALSTTAGIVTAIAGSALLYAPTRLGPLIGLTSKRDAQLVGVLDLALSPGLMFGRPQWPWLAARAVSNVATGAFTLRRAKDGASRRNARVFSTLLAAATVTDLRAVRALARTTA